jgi:hypothetical protein
MRPCLHLIIQYCHNPNPERMAEYEECVRRNLANPYVVLVHDFAEAETVVPDEFRQHPKYRHHDLGRWMTFRDAIVFANASLAGETVCLANLDIFLDAETTDWERASRIVQGPIVLCLSRIEFSKDREPFFDPNFTPTAFAYSQDAWLFRPPLDVSRCDFEIGTFGCDNAFARRVRESGRCPVNDPRRFKIFHYDRCRGKTAGNAYRVHTEERRRQGLEASKHPEHEGYLFVPDIQEVRTLSLDRLVDSYGLSDVERYSLCCEMLTLISQFRPFLALYGPNRPTSERR